MSQGRKSSQTVRQSLASLSIESRCATTSSSSNGKASRWRLLLPVERLEQMRRFARRHALDVMEQQRGGSLTDDQAMELGLEAQRWIRKQKRKPRAKAT